MEIVTNKNSSNEYVLINILTNNLILKEDNELINVTLLSISGIDLLGNRKILGIFNLKEDTNRRYLDLMEEIKGLGVKSIYFIACDFNNKLKKAIKISYPDAICINNFTSTLINLWKYTPIRGRNNLKKTLFNLYNCETYEEASINLESIKEEFYKNKLLSLLYDKYFSDINNYYKYNKVSREFLFSDSFFININDRIRILNQNNRNLSYVDFIKLIKPYMIGIENVKSYNRNKWIDIIDGLSIEFPEIIEKVGNLI